MDLSDRKKRIFSELWGWLVIFMSVILPQSLMAQDLRKFDEIPFEELSKDLWFAPVFKSAEKNQVDTDAPVVLDEVVEEFAKNSAYDLVDNDGVIVSPDYIPKLTVGISGWDADAGEKLTVVEPSCWMIEEIGLTKPYDIDDWQIIESYGLEGCIEIQIDGGETSEDRKIVKVVYNPALTPTNQAVSPE